MNSKWKWDGMHVITLVVFVLVYGGLLAESLVGKNVNYGVLVLVAPGAVFSLIAFFRNPPGSVKEAVEEAEKDFAGGAGGSRGFAPLRALMALSALLLLAALVFLLGGCISSAPVVPVTPQNQAQISSCQGTASLHNGVVIGDFVLGGASAGASGAAALVTDSNTRTGFAVAGAIAGGALIAGTAVAELTASNFTNSRCTDVVGALPTSAAAPPAEH